MPAEIIELKFVASVRPVSGRTRSLVLHSDLWVLCAYCNGDEVIFVPTGLTMARSIPCEACKGWGVIPISKVEEVLEKMEALKYLNEQVAEELRSP